MDIVDAHIHLWGGGTPRAAHRQQPYSKEQALADMDAAGVHSAVIQPPAWDPRAHGVAIDAARSHAQRFAILGNFPLDTPGGEATLERWKSQRGMLGLRYIFNEPRHAAWLEGDDVAWLWSGAERLGIPIALAAAAYLPQVGKLARRYPRLRLLVDHLAVPVGATGPAAFVHIDELVALARLPNVAVKATGAPAYATDAYPYRSIHGYLEKIFDAFGPRRFFWGTDITKMPCSWRQCVTLFTEELKWLPEKDKPLVMGQALRDWIKW
ncbi:MAG TPA: amidohydrolase family protein [Burkholderiales bacterium]|nr:amidohydrolase family protein [Burkholderiales bacterium]